MTAPRDPDRLIHHFLLEGAEQLQDPIYDVVRAEIERKRQRALIGPWRMPAMNKLVPIGLGAAAVVGVLVVGTQLLGPPAPSGPGAAPIATPSPTPTASPSATVEPSPSPPASPPPLTQSYTSPLHGFSVSYPGGWTAQAATVPWADGTFPLNFLEPRVDFLYHPTLNADLFLAIASQPIGDSTPDDWVAEQMTSDEGCGTATEPIAVDAASGLIGHEGCAVAVVTTAGRGYWIQLYTGNEAPVAYDHAWFEEVVATVQLHPEDAVNAGPSPSP